MTKKDTSFAVLYHGDYLIFHTIKIPTANSLILGKHKISGEQIICEFDKLSIDYEIMGVCSHKVIAIE